jgi:hypothetical protein
MRWLTQKVIRREIMQDDKLRTTQGGEKLGTACDYEYDPARGYIYLHANATHAYSTHRS